MTPRASSCFLGVFYHPADVDDNDRDVDPEKRSGPPRSGAGSGSGWVFHGLDQLDAIAERIPELEPCVAGDRYPFENLDPGPR